jgi:CelD/BcsL family acetyltransferase involved in cellulose biosynthesis
MRTGPKDALRVQLIPPAAMLSVLRNHPELIREMRYPGFFSSVSWLHVVLQCGNPENAFGLVVLHGNRPVAMLPLETSRNRLGGYDLRYLGYRFFPDPLGLICAERELPDAIAAIMGYLRSGSRWDRLILDFVLPEEAALWPGHAREQSQAPYLNLPPSAEALLAGFKGEKRYKLRSKLKRADQAGLVFTVADTESEKLRYLDALFQLHAVRSSEVGRASSVGHREVQALHARLVENCPDALLFALQSDGRFVAVVYGFVGNARFSFFQIAHDPRFGKLRPGTVIVYRTIAHLCDAGAAEFNFLQGDEPYKFEWTADTRPLMQVEAGLSAVRSKLLAGAMRARRWGVDNGRALVNALRR